MEDVKYFNQCNPETKQNKTEDTVRTDYLPPLNKYPRLSPEAYLTQELITIYIWRIHHSIFPPLGLFELRRNT